MARMTKRRQIREQMGTSVKTIKQKRKRKPMTEEQKAAAVERLAKARAARQANQGPPKNVHPDVLALSDDDTLSLKNVREWIKTQKEMLASVRGDVRADVKGALARKTSIEGYIRNLDRYIRDGVYADLFYGEHQQNQLRLNSVRMAYDEDGNIKRSFGVFYADLNGVYIGPGKIKVNGVIQECEDV